MVQYILLCYTAMSYRHPRYHSGPDGGPVEAIVGFIYLVVIICSCFALPLAIAIQFAPARDIPYSSAVQ